MASRQLFIGGALLASLLAASAVNAADVFQSLRIQQQRSIADSSPETKSDSTFYGAKYTEGRTEETADTYKTGGSHYIDKGLLQYRQQHRNVR